MYDVVNVVTCKHIPTAGAEPSEIFLNISLHHIQLASPLTEATVPMMLRVTLFSLTLSFGIGIIFNSTKIARTGQLSCNEFGEILIVHILNTVFPSNPSYNIDK